VSADEEEFRRGGIAGEGAHAMERPDDDSWKWWLEDGYVDELEEQLDDKIDDAIREMKRLTKKLRQASPRD